MMSTIFFQASAFKRRGREFLDVFSQIILHVIFSTNTMQVHRNVESGKCDTRGIGWSSLEKGCVSTNVSMQLYFQHHQLPKFHA
jgi:hypothetical protein